MVTAVTCNVSSKNRTTTPKLTTFGCGGDGGRGFIHYGGARPTAVNK